MERLVIYIVLKDNVMNCYTRELLILFRIMISPLCHAYKSFQVFFLVFHYYFPICFSAMVQVEPNRYLSDLSSSRKEILGRLEESETSSRSTRARSTRCQKIRRKFNKHMEFFLVGGGSCLYDDETIGDIEVPLKYKHLVKKWLLRDLPQVNTNFCVNERIYIIASSSLHGMGLFFMDGIKVGYDRCT